MKGRAILRVAAAVLAVVLLAAAPLGTAHAAKGKRPPAAAPVTGVVNLNTATREELEILPGVGEKKADAIVTFRKRHGGFKRIRDLRRVKGFGRKTLRKLAPHLVIQGPTTLQKATD